MDGHTCEKLATAPYMAEGRELWLGKLTSEIPGYPLETHCLHVTTPAKSVVFGIMHGDTEALAVMATIVNDGPLDGAWLERMAGYYRIEEGLSFRRLN